MTSPEQHDSLDQLPEAVVDEGRKGLPIVWLLPIVALLVGGWLIYKTYSEKGPEIVISFKTAEGIEEGKTQVKLKDVKVGHVETVKLLPGSVRGAADGEYGQGTLDPISPTRRVSGWCARVWVPVRSAVWEPCSAVPTLPWNRTTPASR